MSVPFALNSTPLLFDLKPVQDISNSIPVKDNSNNVIPHEDHTNNSIPIKHNRNHTITSKDHGNQAIPVKDHFKVNSSPVEDHCSDNSISVQDKCIKAPIPFEDLVNTFSIPLEDQTTKYSTPVKHSCRSVQAADNPSGPPIRYKPSIFSVQPPDLRQVVGRYQHLNLCDQYLHHNSPDNTYS